VPYDVLTDASLEVRLLGQFDARRNAQPLPPLRSRKGQYLLALLILHYPRETAREWLVGTLWPESDSERGYYNLRRTLYDLRASLGPYAKLLHAPSPHTLAVQIEEETRIDVLQFDQYVAQGHPAALKAAVALYRGPLLEGCSEAWIMTERVARERSYLHALETLAEEALQAEDLSEAIGYLRQSIVTDPFRESAQRRLMETLARRGDYAAATLAYREFRLLLRREINTEPAAETVALFQRLRQEAQESFQTESPVPSPARSLAVEPRRPGLPLPLNSFIGREEERLRLSTILRTNRLLTLVGAGGCGKTRLALQTAREREQEYGDICWVELAAVSDPGLVWGALATALNITEEAGATVRETVCRTLQGRRCLLILDNCEHLLNPVGQMVSLLLQNCPPVRILATSREPLALTGEVTWRVASLSTPEWRPSRSQRRLDHTLTLSELIQYEAVRLFAERAASAAPRFALTEENVHTVARLCCRLDGIPLAIELAASRVGGLTTEQIESRLKDRFRFLRWNRRDLLPRQQTLRALIDWSYDLLTEAERTLFRRLSVFVGGWTLAAAEAACNDECEMMNDEFTPAPDSVLNTQNSALPIHHSSFRIHHSDVLELLSRLVDKSLVVFEGEEVGRYRMLETIRQYALERLCEAGEERETRDSHGAYCLTLAKEANSDRSGDLTLSWLNTLEQEQDNLRAALQNAGSPESLLDFSLHLYWFWNLRGYWDEGRGWLERALQMYPRADALRAKGLNGAGILAWRQGDYATAKSQLQESLDIYQQLQDRAATATALGNLGLVLCDQGEYAAARRCHAKSLEIDREVGNLPNVAARLTNLGLVTMYEGDFEEARRFQDEGIALYRELGHKRGLANSLVNRGLLALREADYSKAWQCNEECVALCRELSLKSALAYALHGLGLAAFQQKRFTEASSSYRESLLLRRELSDRRGLTDSLSCIADLLFVLGKSVDAARLLGTAERLHEEIGASLSPAERADVEESQNALRETMGTEAFQRAREEGRAMALGKAIECALGFQVS
jgi:predicted ATPase/DNA-binding SARP family transcriptional activator